MADALPSGPDSGTTIVVLMVLLFLMQFATLAKGLFAKKEDVTLKQPVRVEGGGEPLRTIPETKFSEKYVHRRDHDGLAESLLRLEHTVRVNTDTLHAEIKETADKSEARTAATHDRLNVLVEKIGELNATVRLLTQQGTRKGS